MFGEVKREGGATKVRWEGGAMLLFIPKVKKSGTPFSQSLPADSTKEDLLLNVKQTKRFVSPKDEVILIH